MKILYFELRKEFIRKSFFFMMIILVIINFFWLEWDYHTNGGFTEDYVKVNASEKENKYYEELHQYLDGKLNAEKVSYVSEEYQRYHNLVSGDYSTEYDSSMHTGYAFGDYSLLTVHFYNPIKYLITYKELNDGLLEKAEENIRFFSDKNNKYEVEKNSFILEHYKNRNPLYFYETGGWKHLLSYDKSDLFILVLLIVGIIPTFSKEKKNAMEIIQITSAYGRKLYIPIKLIAHIFVAVWLELLFGIINYVVIHMQYGLSGTKMMLYSINEYRYTPLNISVIEFYLLEVLSKCIGFAIIAVILTMIARLIKNTYAAFIAMIGYTSVFLYFSGFNSGITLVENVLTLISPFSLLKLGELATSLKEIKFCGHFMTFHSFLYSVQATLIVILLCTMLVIEKRESDFMIRSELYKVFIKQHLILFLFVFLFLNAAYHIVTGYDTTTVIRNSESYYTSFFDKYEGKITTEKTTQIKEEYKKLEKDTVNMLSNKLEKQAFESFYHVYLYESDSGSGYLTDTRGWESILCHDNINYLLAVFVVLLGVMLFSVEYENEMNIMIVSTCGRNRLTGCKIFIGIAGAIISASLFQIIHIMYLVSTIGLHHADYPLNTIEFYENSRYGISLGTALLFKFIVTILGCMLLVSFAMLMTVLLKRREICMVLAVLLVILPRMIFSNSSILYRIPWITPLLSANGFFWPDRYTHQIIDNQLKKVIVFQAIETKTMLIVLSMDIFLIVLSSYIVFGKFSNHRKSKYIKMTSKILPCILICFCLTGCGEISEDKEVIIDGTLNAQINMTIGGNMYYIDQNENLVYCEDAKNNIIAITRNIIPLQQRITNIFVDAHYCYYLLEDDNSSNIIVRSVDLESFEDKLVYSAGSDNTEDFYGLRKDESNDADEILKNIATVNWFIVTDKVIYYQKNSAIYKCSKISGKQEIIAEAVSDDEVQYLKGVLHYTDAHGKKTSYNFTSLIFALMRCRNTREKDIT